MPSQQDPLRPYTRYVAVSAAVAGALILVLMPLASALHRQWARHDVEAHSRAVFDSVREVVSHQIADGGAASLAALFERLTQEEKLLAIGYCDQAGQLRLPTKQMPANFSCAQLARTDTASYSTIESDARPVLVGSFPLQDGPDKGYLAILHDPSFLEARASEAPWNWALGIGGVGVGIGALAAFLGVPYLRQLRRARRRTTATRRAGGLSPRLNSNASLLDNDFRKLLRDLLPAASDTTHVVWTPRTLQTLITEELPDAQVIAVSNREPYIHNHEDGGISLQIPASGLVAALEPIMRACGGTWVAHGSGSADKETVDKDDRIAVPPGKPAYTLRRIWLTEEEQDGYYYGFANEGLWPLCHISFVRPNFRKTDWELYQEVNRRFADAVAREATREDPIVLVQDYHFALLPRMLRDRLPRATILTFWHVPWPNAETFSICPWKEEIVRGLLGSTILGFHTQFHCNNFLETVDRFVESRIDREQASVTLSGHETMVRSYPISIEWPPVALEGQKSAEECRKAVRKRFHLGEEVRFAIGVERFDYTKGVLDRMRAVDELLTHHEQWRGRFAIIQAAAPTRSKLDAYRELQDEAIALARSINEKYRDGDYQPIHLAIRHHEPSEVFELFRAADMCVVSSLHDGMNLVAKEFVAARDDERGVLILSHFAGAARELAEALIVNPYDASGMADAINRALVMPDEEQRARMRLMRALVREHNVYRWAGRMLLDAARLRRKQYVLDVIERHRTGE